MKNRITIENSTRITFTDSSNGYNLWDSYIPMGNDKYEAFYSVSHSSGKKRCPICGKFADHFNGSLESLEAESYSCGTPKIISKEELINLVESYKEDSNHHISYE